jgi:hypothetical protein
MRGAVGADIDLNGFTIDPIAGQCGCAQSFSFAF